MTYPFMIDLSESKLIPSETSLKKWDENVLRELAYLYFLALYVLVDDGKTDKWAVKYCEKAAQAENFEHWRTDGNDLYVLLYGLKNCDECNFAPSLVRDWLHHAGRDDFDQWTHKLFNRLDAMFHITDATLKALRRTIGHWSTISNVRERKQAVDKVIHHIEKLAPSNCEILSHLKHIDRDVKESASAGSTSVASVATAVGGLGAGFSPSESWRSIYGNKKPVVLRRTKKIRV